MVPGDGEVEKLGHIYLVSSLISIFLAEVSSLRFAAMRSWILGVDLF